MSLFSSWNAKDFVLLAPGTPGLQCPRWDISSDTQNRESSLPPRYLLSDAQNRDSQFPRFSTGLQHWRFIIFVPLKIVATLCAITSAPFGFGWDAALGDEVDLHSKASGGNGCTNAIGYCLWTVPARMDKIGSLAWMEYE